MHDFGWESFNFHDAYAYGVVKLKLRADSADFSYLSPSRRQTRHPKLNSCCGHGARFLLVLFE